MSKFNGTNTNKTVNRYGQEAYKMDKKTKLVSMTFTTMFGEKKAYGDNSSELVQLAESTDMNFVANLAVYARNEMNLRSVAHVLTCVVARYGKGSLTRKAVHGVSVRPDDLTEIMACYLHMYGKPFPNALKRQVAEEMNRFNEYGFAKCNGGNKEVKFKDILRITHPHGNASQAKLFKKILDDRLETPYTWEVELSARGNTKEVWEELIDSDKVGYMALLRNLRNIINANPNNINKVYAILANEERVKKSKQLPFRFYSAYKMLKKAGLASTKVVDTLEDAISASCANIEKIPGKTLIAVDVSGSMSYCTISSKSEVHPVDIASVLGAIATRICDDAEVVTFDRDLHKYTMSSRNGILANAEKMNANGGRTNMALPFEYIIRKKKMFDRIIVLSDNEVNCGRGSIQHYADEYRREVNPNFWVHAIDLQGYGTQQFMGPKTNIIAGWNERVFEFINCVEKGFDGMVKAIEDYL